MDRVSFLFIFILSITCVFGQFNFDKEVAGLFNFDRIPKKFESSPKDKLYSTVDTPATNDSPARVFTAFSIPEPSDRLEELDLEESEEIKEKADVLPGFEEDIKRDSFESEVETEPKKRSYGVAPVYSYGGGGHGNGGYSSSGGSHGGGDYGGGGGYESDHEGGLVSYGSDSGQKVQPKAPGPYGPASPNFKCEKSKETLFVTKTDFTVDQKCFTVFKVECSQGYDTGKVDTIKMLNLT